MKGGTLVACERSQAVTIALRALGVQAFSCDIEMCEGGHPEWHMQGDVIPLLEHEWDMIIAFPPCTHLANSGARWFAAKRADGRQQQGIDFFMHFTRTQCEHVAIENPIGIMSTQFRKPDQIVHPYMFGDPYQKATCLWLKGLPLLTPTNVVEKGTMQVLKSGKRIPEWYSNAPKKERGYARSRTFPGMAQAMAAQWAAHIRR